MLNSICCHVFGTTIDVKWTEHYILFVYKYRIYALVKGIELLVVILESKTRVKT